MIRKTMVRESRVKMTKYSILVSWVGKEGEEGKKGNEEEEVVSEMQEQEEESHILRDSWH